MNKKNFNIINSQGFPEMESFTSSAGKRFYCRPDGVWVPSVTTILSKDKDDALQNWRDRVGSEEAEKISAIATRRGKILHKVCEDYILDSVRFPFIFEDTYNSLMPDSKETFNKIKKQLDDRMDNVHHVEAPLHSIKHRMAGRTDLIAEWNGALSIIDFKSSLVAKKEAWIVNYFEQEAAYAIMYEELTGKKINQIVTIVSALHERDADIFIQNLTVTKHRENFLKKVADYKESYYDTKLKETK